MRFLLDKSLDPQSEPPKEYEVALEVFDRGDGFDPRIDSIVRVQVNRLRAKLTQYYSGTGREDEWILEVPAGSYAVTLRPRVRSTTAPEEVQIQAAARQPDVAVPAPRRRVFVGAGVAVLAPAFFLTWYLLKQGAPTDVVSAPAPLTAYPGWETDPSFSPDASYFAFSWDGEKQENTDIYVQPVGSATPVRLTSDAAPDFGSVWSPDGRLIAFLRGTAPSLELRLVPPSGGSEVKIAQLTGHANVAWSPDSRWLVVSTRKSPGEPNAIFLLSRDGGTPRGLTSPAGNTAGDFHPAISPDGRKLAFVRENALMVMALSGGLLANGEPRRVFTGDPTDVVAIAWTPGGNDLIVCGNTGSADRALWSIPVDGSAVPRMLSAAGTAGNSLGVSQPIAQGMSRLAYAREIFDTNIWRVEVTTPDKGAGAPERLITSTRNDTNPQYSPDGSRIAFASTRSGNFEVWVAKADGSHPVQLTFLGKYSATPRWSPDGEWIAFDSNSGGQWDIFVVGARGGGVRRLTNHPALDAIPSWSRNGHWIYFSSDRTGDQQIWKMPVTGGEPVQVTQAGGHVAFESSDGKTLYYTRESVLHPSLWAIPVDGGRETKVLDAVSWRGFAPTRDGIWFLRWYGAERLTRIHFHGFAGGPLATAAEIKDWAGNGLSVSPDGRMLLFTCRETAGSDLMFMDKFR